jgi:nucleotide-binding universal stress UspA family protein
MRDEEGDELVLGSFSHHLVHHSRRPVVVVPPAKS